MSGEAGLSSAAREHAKSARKAAELFRKAAGRIEPRYAVRRGSCNTVGSGKWVCDLVSRRPSRTRDFCS